MFITAVCVIFLFHFYSSISFRSKNRDKEPSFRIPLFDLIDNLFSSLENI